MKTTFAVHSIALCIAVSTSAFLTDTSGSAATRVYLLAGQSNMCGQGAYSSELSAPYNAPQSNVKFWSNNQWVALQGGFGITPSEFGPEVGFGYKIHSIYPKDDIYLVKYAVSSTTLAVDWNPAGSGGPQYNAFKSTATAALQNLTAAGRSPTVAGMLWMQGESDALNANYAPNYQLNLTAFIAKVRTDLNAPNMEFALGRILTYWGTADNNAVVRMAEQTVPGLVGNATWINTDDLQIGSAPGHYGTHGQIDLGTRFATALPAITLPEPGTMVLLATALIGLLAYAWRRRK